jgi:hypothetical protein
MGDLGGAEEAWARVEKDGRRTDPRTVSLFLSTKGKKLADALALATVESQTRGDIYTDDALAWALYRVGRVAEAESVIDHARRHGTKDARLLYHQGAIHVAAGDVAGGKKLVAEALARNPAFDTTGAAEALTLLDGAAKPKS